MNTPERELLIAIAKAVALTVWVTAIDGKHLCDDIYKKIDLLRSRMEAER